MKNTYDSSSHTDFKTRPNAGFAKVPLPGWVAGEEMSVKAKVTVSAGVNLQQLTASDIEVVREGAEPVVVIRIPAATILSTEIDGKSGCRAVRQGPPTAGRSCGSDRGLRRREVDEIGLRCAPN